MVNEHEKDAESQARIDPREVYEELCCDWPLVSSREAAALIASLPPATRGEPGWFRLSHRLASGAAYIADHGFTKGDTSTSNDDDDSADSTGEQQQEQRQQQQPDKAFSASGLVVNLILLPIERAAALRKLPDISTRLSSILLPTPPPEESQDRADSFQLSAGQDDAEAHDMQAQSCALPAIDIDAEDEDDDDFAYEDIGGGGAPAPVSGVGGDGDGDGMGGGASWSSVCDKLMLAASYVTSSRLEPAWESCDASETLLRLLETLLSHQESHSLEPLSQHLASLIREHMSLKPSSASSILPRLLPLLVPPSPPSPASPPPPPWCLPAAVLCLASSSKADSSLRPFVMLASPLLRAHAHSIWGSSTKGVGPGGDGKVAGEACRVLARLIESEAAQAKAEARSEESQESLDKGGEAAQAKAEARSEESQESLDKGGEAAQGEPERLATVVAASVILGGFGGEIVSFGLARSCASSWKEGRWRMLVLCASAASQECADYFTRVPAVGAEANGEGGAVWRALWPVIVWWRGKGGKGGGGAEPNGDEIFKLMAEWIESVSVKGEEKEKEKEGGGGGGKGGGYHAGCTVARILLLAMLSDPRGGGSDMVASLFSRGKNSGGKEVAVGGKQLLDKIKESLVAVQARINEAEEGRGEEEEGRGEEEEGRGEEGEREGREGREGRGEEGEREGREGREGRRVGAVLRSCKEEHVAAASLLKILVHGSEETKMD